MGGHAYAYYTCIHMYAYSQVHLYAIFFFFSEGQVVDVKHGQTFHTRRAFEVTTPRVYTCALMQKHARADAPYFVEKRKVGRRACDSEDTPLRTQKVRRRTINKSAITKCIKRNYTSNKKKKKNAS